MDAKSTPVRRMAFAATSIHIRRAQGPGECRIATTAPKRILAAVETETLARKLGTTTHVSPLLMKARRLGLCDRADLLDEAVARGCFHYLQGPTPPVQRVSDAVLSHGELAILLLSTQSDPWSVRVGAMLLGADGNDAHQLSRLAVEEGCVPVVRAIAGAATRYEPDHSFWKVLLEELPEVPPPEIMPHHSRFASVPGLIGPRTYGKAVWLRPLKIRSLGYAV